MNPKFFGFNEKIGRLVKVPADQSRIVATAVAMAVAAHARLPSSQVENLAAFYAEQVHPVALMTISEINESAVFASRVALEYIQTFWKMRYYAAFPAHMVENTSSTLERLVYNRNVELMDLTTIWAGGALELSAELTAFLNKYRAEIATLAGDLVRLLSIQAIGPDECNASGAIGG